MVIDHIGIAVRNLEEGIEHWTNVFGYQQMTTAVVNTRQKVRIAFLSKENSITIKLIEPTDPASPVYAFAKRGGGLHHLCFKCSNLKDGINRLGSRGLRVMVKPEPGEAFGNEEIAFLFDKHGVNIELIDTDQKAGLISPATE